MFKFPKIENILFRVRVMQTHTHVLPHSCSLLSTLGIVPYVFISCGHTGLEKKSWFKNKIKKSDFL